MSKTVLIADQNAERAKEVGELCARHGINAIFAVEGPTALQVAISELPDLAVIEMNLPLIDGSKLAEILRTNPKTQEMRFLFLGQSPGGDRGVEFYDEVLEEPIGSIDVARRIEEIFARRERLNELGHEAESADELSGSLSQVSLADLLQLFQMNQKTGVLELQRKDRGFPEERGSIEIIKGNVSQARLGEVEKEKALFRFFHWNEGSFSFLVRELKTAPKIEMPTRELLMEGIRQLDEWTQRQDSLPPLGSQVALKVKKSELPKMVHPLSQEVLLLLEVYHRVQDIVDHCSFPDYPVLQVLYTLAQRGIIQVRDALPQPRASHHEAGFTGAQGRRLRDWIDARSTRGGKLADAKLLVASSEIETTKRFARVLRGLPGVRIEGAFAGSTFSTDDLMTMAKLPVEADLGIRLIHVPTNRECSASWPLIGHGGLALVSLLGVRPAKSLRELRLVREMMSSVPESRCFFVVLTEGSEEGVRQDLQEELGLADQNAIFVMPIRREDECQKQLRSLLGRILP